MKALIYSFLVVMTIASFSGCYVASTAHAFYKAPGFKPDATFKIIAANTDDILLGRMENRLLLQGFNLISDNYIRGAIPAGTTVVSHSDTTYQIPNNQIMALRFADDQPTDYVIKYQYKTTLRNRINFLNINIVNTKTGKTEVAFSFPERARQGYKVINIDDAIELFAANLK